MFSRSKHGCVDVIYGDLPWTADHRDDIWQLFEPCLEQGLPRVIVDFKQIPLLDSRGLELLLDMRDACRVRGGSLTLAEPNPLCRDILSITGVSDEFEIWSDVVEAAGRFAL